MGKVTIDGIGVEVADGTNLMEVAAKAGVEIPHFCYHPGLAIVAQCRMCLVDIAGVPKVQPACNSFAKDGMVVDTKNEKVKEAQRAVMEFLLINHPLDCPICDQAGECKLQDNSFGFGQGGSRYDLMKRQYPGFDRTKIGPHVVADMTRCIQCTRCIRFTQQISETSELTFQERGGRTLVWTHDGAPLDNEMSACAADVCPVGALTVNEFRFRARVWYLEKTSTVCPGCDVGCNVTVETKDRIAYRFLPRENRDVNDWWMCDWGRFLVEGYNRRDLGAARRGTETIPLDDAYRAVAALLLEARESKKRTAVLAPGSLPTEALWLSKELAAAVNGDALGLVPRFAKPRRVKNGDAWVEGWEAVPNGSGSRALGLGDSAALLTGSGNPPEVLVVVDGDLPELADEKVAEALRKAKKLVVFGRLDTPLARAADLLLPLAPFIDGEGTFVNGRGRIQKLDRAMLPAAGARPAWELLSRIGRLVSQLGDEAFAFRTATEVYDAMAAEVPAFAGTRFAGLPAGGHPWKTPPYEATPPGDTLSRAPSALGEPVEAKKVPPPGNAPADKGTRNAGTGAGPGSDSAGRPKK